MKIIYILAMTPFIVVVFWSLGLERSIAIIVMIAILSSFTWGLHNLIKD